MLEKQVIDLNEGVIGMCVFTPFAEQLIDDGDIGDNMMI